jgi:hypothetical protein
MKPRVAHTTALPDLLSHHGFHRHTLGRNQVGHFQLVGLLGGEPNAISNSVDYAKFYSRSDDAVIRVFDLTRGKLQNRAKGSTTFH